jgi:hypothetical protein
MMKSKLLDAAALLLCLVGAFYLFQGIWALGATEEFKDLWAQMIGDTVTPSPVLTMAVQFFGVLKVVFGAFLAIVALIPLRRGEKWSWFTILVLYGIDAVFLIILWSPRAPFMYLFVLMWAAALCLSVKPVFGKRKKERGETSSQQAVAQTPS